MKRKITSFILCLAMLVSIVAVLPIASAAADTTFKGTDVTLTDGILLNFYVEADDALGIDNAEKDGNYYVLTVGVAAKEMGDDVTAEFKAGATVVGSHTYSVADYAAGILAGSYDAETKALVTAMLNYGAAAQKYFGYKTDALVGTPVTDTTALKAATVAPVAVEGDGFIGASLVLEGTMTLRFYFAGTVDSATVDGEAADVNADAAEYCYVDVKVTPDAIDKAYEVVAGETTVTYSVLNYLKNNADVPELSQMVASIYAYGVAADAYLAENCTHEGAEYEVTQLPTLFTKGLKVAHCDRCGEELRESIDETKAELNEVPLGTDNNTLYETAHIGTALGDKTFYPTADDPDGNDLYLEYSILLYEDLEKFKVNTIKVGGIYNKENIYDDAGKTVKNFTWLYMEPNTQWCNFQGGFEFSESKKFTLDGGETWKTYSQNNNNEEDFVIIDGFDGWHRIGLKYHQNVYEDNGTFTYDVSITVYIDGVEVAENILEWGSFFYSAERVGNEIVYTQNSAIADYYVAFYRYGRADIEKGNDKVYLPVGDCFLSVGDDFVLDVSPVENPEVQDFTQDGVTLPGKQYYELNIG